MTIVASMNRLRKRVISMSYDYSENILVQESAGHLIEEELGWRVELAYNKEVLGENGTFGRKSYKEILLVKYFKEALSRLNPWMTPALIDDALKTFEYHMSSASLMQINEGKNICVISGESIAVEAAILDGEGDVIAVEYNSNDRSTLEDNVVQFGLNNVTIIDHVDEETMKGLAVPDVTMLVASASMEKEMECLIKLNPNMEFVIYTLDFVVAASMPEICRKFGIRDPEIIQVSVSKLSSKNTFTTQPAPWLISGKVGE